MRGLNFYTPPCSNFKISMKKVEICIFRAIPGGPPGSPLCSKSTPLAGRSILSGRTHLNAPLLGALMLRDCRPTRQRTSRQERRGRRNWPLGPAPRRARRGLALSCDVARVAITLPLRSRVRQRRPLARAHARVRRACALRARFYVHVAGGLRGLETPLPACH